MGMVNMHFPSIYLWLDLCFFPFILKSTSPLRTSKKVFPKLNASIINGYLLIVSIFLPLSSGALYFTFPTIHICC